MEIVKGILLVICGILIVLVLMQSSKSTDVNNIMSGGTSDLFKNRKERGSELVISRLTLILGLVFVITCLVLSFL
ncbi:MAG: preprotein translocase subunit SecG [Bacilli bacterium]|nr:preprotein translocase subunit SecG [Bacilli bacterium]